MELNSKDLLEWICSCADTSANEAIYKFNDWKTGDIFLMIKSAAERAGNICEFLNELNIN